MKVSFELFGMVKSKGKTIAIGDGGKFSIENGTVIRKLDQLGFKRIDVPIIKSEEKKEGIKPSEPVIKKKTGRPPKVKK